ncbi:hypothetical protein QQ39_16245 [Pragia fontium]|nr:hypothetical protein QQ39_16245 [Pragia fontium]
MSINANNTCFAAEYMRMSTDHQKYSLDNQSGYITTRLMAHIRDNPAKEVYEDGFFSIRYFQKGTAHLMFKRLDLVEKMNDIIAKYYPGMLPAK